MSGKPGSETLLVGRMRKAGNLLYVERVVITKYHGSGFSETGVSDLLGVCDSIMFACEVKHPKNYGGSVERALSEGPSFKQRAYLKRVAAAGGVASVAATVEQFLETLRRCADREVGWADFREQPRGVMDT